MNEPDVVAELNDFLREDDRDSFVRLVARARDEIVALRSFADGCRGAAARIRAEALEEAARYCESLRLTAFGEPSDEFRYNNQLCENFARGIRALKDKSDA